MEKIDGVDVSECDYYRVSIPNTCGKRFTDCEGVYCLYKKLKHKEQDYETLANQYNAVVEQNRKLQKELNKYIN